VHKRRLLCARRERPSGYRTNNSFDEIASSHCLPQGLGQGIVAGQLSALKVAGKQSPNVRFGSKADIAEHDRHVCFVPKADIRDFIK